MALLPAYSLVLGLLALLGYMALAAGVRTCRSSRRTSRPTAPISPCRRCSCTLPLVRARFAAIGIGALVPAAIMSIAAANLYTRNIHKEFINRA